MIIMLGVLSVLMNPRQTICIVHCFGRRHEVSFGTCSSGTETRSHWRFGIFRPLAFLSMAIEIRLEASLLSSATTPMPSRLGIGYFAGLRSSRLVSIGQWILFTTTAHGGDWVPSLEPRGG